MPWNGNVTGSSVASTAEAHGPKEMDRVNKYFNDVDLETATGFLDTPTIRTKTRYRSGKLQFIDTNGFVLDIIIPGGLTNNKTITLPNDSGILALGGGGTPVSTITNLGLGGIGVFKGAAAGIAELYSLASISNAIDIELDAVNNLIEFSLDQTQINLANLAGNVPISKGGTGQTTAVNAFDALAPTTSSGDIIYRNQSGDNVRLGIGPNGYVLGVSGGLPVWIAPPSGGGGGGGSGLTLHRNASVVDVVNTGAETNIFSFTVSGGTIGNTGLLHIIVTGSYLNNSGSDDSYDLKLKLGGTTIWQDSSGTQTSSSNRRPVYIELWIKNNNSASSQRIGGTFVNGNAVLADVGISDISDDEIRGESPIVASSTINTAADAVLALTVDHADASSNISFQADIASVELVGGTGGGGGTGDVTGASNVGSGAGLIFRDEIAGVLNFKRILAGTNITVTNGTDDVTIASTGTGIHKDTHKSGGSDPFAKGDLLIAEPRYLESQTSDPASDSRRAWIGGATGQGPLRFWDNQGTPAKHTVIDDQTSAGGDLTGTYPNPTITTNAVADAEIAAHTSTKVTITAKGQLNGAILYSDVDNALGAHFLEFDEIADPAAPAANKGRVFFDNTDEKLKIIKNGGAVVDLEAAGGGTPAGASGDVQYNSGSSTFAAETAFNYDFTNNQLKVPGLTIDEDFILNGDLTPAQITANQNDYNPTNLATAARLRLSTDASRNITGLQGGTDGRIILIINVGSTDIVLTNEDALSTAGNRFTLGASLTLTANKIALLMYDGTTSRWRLVATSVDQTGGGGGSPGGATGDLQYNSGSSTFAAEAALNYDATNNRLVAPGVKVDNEFLLNGDISPAQITANQNDYNPTNLATSTVLRLSTDASRNITGLTAPASNPDGTIKVIVNVGTTDIVLKNQDALSTAANRFLFGSDVTLTADKIAVIIYDATTSRWRLVASTVAPAAAIPTEIDIIEMARNRIGYIEDFFNVTDKSNYTTLVSGTGAAFANVDTVDLGVFGVGQFTTGTTATGRGCIYGSGATTTHQAIRLGQGITTIEGKIRLPALSSATQEYRFIFGLGDLPTGPSQTEGCWIEYERTNSVNWRYSTGDDNTKTENSSTTAVAANTWIRLKIVVNAAANSVEFFVNGTSIGTTTTNIPSAAGDELFPICGIFKSVGTTASLADIDYYAVQIDLTTPR